MRNFFIALGSVAIYFDNLEGGEITTTSFATQQLMTDEYFESIVTSVTTNGNEKMIITNIGISLIFKKKT